MKVIIGKILFKIFSVFPSSSSKISFGGKMFRGLCGKLIFKKCGKRVNVDRNCAINEYIEIGDYSGIGKNSFIDKHVSIGKYVMMGQNCNIFTRNHKFEDISKPMCFQGFSDYKPVVIEDDVWIGANVIILPGIRIGKGSIIGAGSVVTKSVEPYSVVGGNPAHCIKHRK